VEWFNGTLRAECLNVHWFETLTEAKQVIASWGREYNESRPHRPLGERTPSEFACLIALNGDQTSSQAALPLKVLHEKGAGQTGESLIVRGLKMGARHYVCHKERISSVHQ
jgi:hypothetical protein